MQKLNETWIITSCNSKKFALNSIYVESIKNFNSDKCINTVTHPGIYRGTFKISNDNLIILDGRKILGEETILEITNKFKHEIGQVELEVLEIQNIIQLSLITNHNNTEIKQYKLNENCTNTINKLNDFLNNISDNTYKNKYRVNYSVLELKLLFNKIVEEINKEKTEDSWQTYKQIEYVIIRLCSELEKIEEEYSKKFNEHCIIINYKENKFGLLIDKIEAVSSEIELLKPNEDCFTYKAIAGLCKYKEQNYYIFNIKYLNELAKRFQK